MHATYGVVRFLGQPDQLLQLVLQDTNLSIKPAPDGFPVSVVIFVPGDALEPEAAVVGRRVVERVGFQESDAGFVRV